MCMRNKFFTLPQKGISIYSLVLQYCRSVWAKMKADYAQKCNMLRFFCAGKIRSAAKFASYSAVWAEAISRIDRLPLFTMMFCAFVTAVGFFVGKAVSYKAFWLGVALSFSLALLHSIARAVGYLLMMAGIWLVTAYTFTYVHWDASVCHFPMAQAMVEGWNPVLDATHEGLKTTLKGVCNFDHILCAPKITAIVSAVVSKGTNLFTATMFLPCCLFIALFSVAFRFVVEEFRCSKTTGALFAISIFLPVELINYLMYGTVDSVKYASTLASVFALLLWIRTKSREDAVMFCMCLSVCAVCKTAGIGIWIMLGGAFLVFNWKRRLCRMLALSSFIFVAAVGTSPYITQWIHGGSPFYPSHSFVENRPKRDLTHDFISSRNSDALEMGAIGRVIYAWFSQDLAKSGTKWYLDKDKYNPIFGWPSATGYGENFSFLMWLSLCLLPFIKNKKPFLFFMIVFLVDNIAPLRYLGFYRYFPEMYAIPFVTLMGFAYSPRWSSKGGRKVLAVGWNVILTGIAFLTLRNLIQWYDFTFSMERLRQNQYKKISDIGAPVVVKSVPHRVFEPVASRRLMAAGIEPVKPSKRKSVNVYFTDKYNWFRTMVPGLDRQEADRLVEELKKEKQIRHGLIHDITSLEKINTHYQYGGMGWPHILFQPSPEMLRKFKKGGKQ